MIFLIQCKIQCNKIDKTLLFPRKSSIGQIESTDDLQPIENLIFFAAVLQIFHDVFKLKMTIKGCVESLFFPNLSIKM